MKKTIATLWVFAISFVLAALAMNAEARAHALDRTLSFRELTNQMQTPEEIARYMWRNFQFESDQTNFGKEEYWQTAQEFLQNRRGDCEDFAIFANEMLKLNGVSSFILNIYGSGGFAHTVCVFKENGRYSVIDGTQVLHFKSKSITDLMSKIYPFWKEGAIVSATPYSTQGEILTQFSKQNKSRRHLAMSA
ncbi:MAG: transglutaminase-like cysteine peptidase [Candidatus Omnitrophica bacterium]|nr:transglutaminase-like cysteine peptidase [Candidatus Omnitrophota bacterium]